MKRNDARQLLDLIQLLADDEECEQEKYQMLMDFGYYTCVLEHGIKFDKFDNRRLDMLKEKYWSKCE